jgi:hypothetical protein
MRDWRLSLRWKRTWPDRLDDLTGQDPKDPRCLAYVRRNRAPTTPAEAWLWSVAADGQSIASGYTAEGPLQAVHAAEKVWEEWKSRQDVN